MLDVLSRVPLIGNADLPLLAAPLVPVYLTALVAVNLLILLLARLVNRESVEPLLRRLRWLAAVMAGSAAWQLVALSHRWSGQSVLLLVYSLLELSVLTSLLVVVWLLVKRRVVDQRSLQWLALVACGALFCGLFGGGDGRSLLARNLPAALCQLGVYLGLAGVLWQTLRSTLLEHHDRLQERLDDLVMQNLRLEQKGAHAGREVDEARDRLDEQTTDLESLRQRGRVLEQILAVSARINATRGMSDLLDRVVTAVAEILGFQRVILHLYSDSTQAFEARAFAGVPDQEMDGLTGTQVSAELFGELTDPRHRYSNCFLIVADEYSGTRAAPDKVADPGDVQSRSRQWRDGHCLIAPLVAPSGETRGYLTVDRPADGKVPTVLDIRPLEFLVRLATIAIEAVEVHERLAHNNSELARVSEKLKSLGDMKANFVANVSHELRTPLTSISAYTELLQQNTDTMTDEMREEFLRVINKESGKLTLIIEDLLELSRMDEGTARLARVQTDLVSLAWRLEESWRSRAQAQTIDFRITISSDRIDLDVDPVLLQQLLAHLLGNAFKFTPQGGRVTLDLQECGTAVKITVEDSGIGIPEEQLDAIFERFYQVDDSATREHSGQGVGLALCQDIVSYHDGRIWAENVSPGGARFTVVLPRRPAVLQPIESVRQIPALHDPAQFMQRLLSWVSETLSVGMVSLMLPDEQSGDLLVIRAAIGLSDTVVQSTSVRRGVGIAGKVWVTGRPLLIADVTEDPRFSGEQSDPRYTTPSLLCVPLIHDLDVLGVVTVNNRSDDQPLDGDDLMLLEALAPRITSLLRKHAAQQISAQQFAAIQESLRATTTVGHLCQDHVSAVCREICLATARRIALPSEEMEHLTFALQFYDVGMSYVPAHLVHRPGLLGPDERLEVAEHVPLGLAILAPLEPPPKVRQIILHHHENYDGTGYPDGLEGEAIPLGARMLRLTDCFGALLQSRSYRQAYSYEDAVAEVRNRAGKDFCPRLTEEFLAEVEARRERLVRVCDTNSDTAALARPILFDPVVPVRI